MNDPMIPASKLEALAKGWEAKSDYGSAIYKYAAGQLRALIAEAREGEKPSDHICDYRCHGENGHHAWPSPSDPDILCQCERCTAAPSASAGAALTLPEAIEVAKGIREHAEQRRREADEAEVEASAGTEGPSLPPPRRARECGDGRSAVFAMAGVR